MSEKAKLLERVAAAVPAAANPLRTTTVEVLRFPDEFLKRGAAYQITARGRSGPSVFMVGTAEPNVTVLLNNNPAGFVEFAGKAGLQLDTPGRRSAYVMTYLMATLDFAVRTQFLPKFPELIRRATTTDADVARYQAQHEKYAGVVKPLSLTPAENTPPWKGATFALVIWNLVRYDVKLSADGTVDVARAVLEPTVADCIKLDDPALVPVKFTKVGD